MGIDKTYSKVFISIKYILSLQCDIYEQIYKYQLQNRNYYVCACKFSNWVNIYVCLFLI